MLLILCIRLRRSVIACVIGMIAVWLVDCCRCKECGEGHSQGRKIYMELHSNRLRKGSVHLVIFHCACPILVPHCTCGSPQDVYVGEAKLKQMKEVMEV